MFFKKFKLYTPSTGIGLIVLALTQLPMSINESLKVACFVTTWADYAVFWEWQDIPLDARVRHCQGTSTSTREFNDSIPTTKILD